MFPCDNLFTLRDCWSLHCQHVLVSCVILSLLLLTVNFDNTVTNNSEIEFENFFCSPVTHWTWTALVLCRLPLSCPSGTATRCCSCRAPSPSPSSCSSSPTSIPVFNLRVRGVLEAPEDRERKKKVVEKSCRFIGLECRQSLTTSSHRYRRKDSFHPW